MNIEDHLRSILRDYVSPTQDIHDSHFIGRDLGVIGGDAVEFLNRVEAECQVDLRPLIETGPPPRRQPWWTWIAGHRVTNTGTDVTIKEMSEYIRSWKEVES
jgi:hypothetical protein